MLADGLAHRTEDDAGLCQLFLERRHDAHTVEHRIDGHLGRAFHAQQHFLLFQRNAELLVGLQDLRIDLVQALVLRPALRRRVIARRLVVDRRILHERPGRLFHGQPTLERPQPPFEHPFRLALLSRNVAHDVGVEPRRRQLLLQLSDKAVLVLLRLQRARRGHRTLVDAFLHRAHATASLTARRAAILASTLSASSTSLSFDSWPKLTRSAPLAKSGATPIAASTRLERTLPDEHAAPELTATPSRSMAITAVSALSPGSAKLEVLGRRATLLPKTMASPGKPASKRSRSADARAASAFISRSAHSTAVANPTTAAPFSVPGRRPRSCPPPNRVVANGAPGASTSAPAPGGPPSLWLETTRYVASRSAMLTGIRPNACAASTSRSAPCSRQSAATCATGWITPVSLFASCSASSTGFGASRSMTVRASRSINPVRSRGARNMARRLPSSNSASCSHSATMIDGS